MLNQEKVGTRYPTYRYEVSREKVREYAEATGAGGRYDAEIGDVVAPPTFAACFALGREAAWGQDPDLGVHPRFLHGAQTFDFHRPVRVGDVLDCTPRIASIEVRGRTEFMVVAVDGADAETGEPVVTSSATLIFLDGDA